jgi:hypothetical protein
MNPECGSAQLELFVRGLEKPLTLVRLSAIQVSESRP